LEQPVTCERCGQTHAACKCPRGRDGKVLDPKDQALRVRREKRGGKMMTVVSGLSPRSERTNDLPAMLKQLKATLGAGGTVLDDGFEIQGDHRDKLVEHFKRLGYPAKPAGG
jgi:translation initiation factor 1